MANWDTRPALAMKRFSGRDSPCTTSVRKTRNGLPANCSSAIRDFSSFAKRTAKDLKLYRRGEKEPENPPLGLILELFIAFFDKIFRCLFLSHTKTFERTQRHNKDY